MKAKFTGILLMTAVVFSGPLARPAAAQETVQPVISLQGVPFTDAVQVLARQAGTNYIFDTGYSFTNLAGATVSRRWTNVTAQAALADLLESRGLTMVTNPVTTVLRIMPGNVVSRRSPVPASELGNDPGPVLPVVIMEMTPLADAVKLLARQAGVDYEMGTGLVLPNTPVSIRWTKLTAKQALVALLDAYGYFLDLKPGARPRILVQLVY